MKKRRKRYGMALLLAALFLGIQIGCGRPEAAEDGSGETPRTMAEDTAEGESSPAEEDQVKAMGRYVETALALPEGNDYMGRAMALLSDGSLAYYDAQSGLNLSPDMGESWEKRRDTKEVTERFFEESPYITNAAIGPDGGLAIIAMDYSESGNGAATVLVVDPEGNVTGIPADFADGDYPSRISYRGEGELYIASIRGRICRVNTENQELKEIFTASDWVEVMALAG